MVTSIPQRISIKKNKKTVLSHLKFVTLLTVYLDKKHFTLTFSFLYSEAPFSMGPDYRDKCKALLMYIKH